MIVNNSLPKILIVEDRRVVRETFKLFLGGEADIIFATNPEEAKSVIDNNSDIALMAVDGSLVKKGDGAEVVNYARQKSFSCPIVAISGDDNSELIKAGADEEVSKANSFEFIKHRLELITC
jgi:CheY-like chemotaxis protein